MTEQTFFENYDLLGGIDFSSIRKIEEGHLTGVLPDDFRDAVEDKAINAASIQVRLIELIQPPSQLLVTEPDVYWIARIGVSSKYRGETERLCSVEPGDEGTPLKAYLMSHLSITRASEFEEGGEG